MFVFRDVFESIRSIFDNATVFFLNKIVTLLSKRVDHSYKGPKAERVN